MLHVLLRRRAQRHFEDMPSIRHDPPAEAEPATNGYASVIVPARNEQRNVARVLESLRAQDHSGHQVILVDDDSDDGTGAIARSFPVEVIKNGAAPEGWVGKNHACHVGRKRAFGEWLLFTDADTEHRSGALRNAIDFAERNEIDVLSVIPRWECDSFWARALIPYVYFHVHLSVPSRRVNSPDDSAACGVGGFLLFRATAYDRIDAHRAVRDKVAEDVLIAHLAKRSGLRYAFVRGHEIVSVRMYDSFGEVFEGYEKNMVDLLRTAGRDGANSVLSGIAASLTVVLAVSALARGDRKLRAAALAAYAVPAVTIARWNRRLGVAPAFALLHPVAAVVVDAILLMSAHRSLVRKRVVWKGRECDTPGVRFRVSSLDQQPRVPTHNTR